jgi:hypothetical protein
MTATLFIILIAPFLGLVYCIIALYRLSKVTEYLSKVIERCSTIDLENPNRMIAKRICHDMINNKISKMMWSFKKINDKNWMPKELQDILN